MSKRTTKKRPTARAKSLKVRYVQGGKHLSSQVGLIPVIRFLDRLGFDHLFRRHVDHERGPGTTYQLVDMVFLLVVGLIGGSCSIQQSVLLWADGVLRRVAGWKRIPDDGTVGRVLKEVKERHVNGLESLVHALRRRVWERAWRSGRSQVGLFCQLWIDIDSTVKTVYGRQEGSAKGYNPHKRGARSYHPILAFCAQTKEIVQGWLRSGDAYTSNGVVEFVKQMAAQMPGHCRLVIRADSGFFSGALLSWLEQNGHGYLIKVKLKGLGCVLAGQTWTAIGNGWEQCEFSYQAGSWDKARRMVAVRRRKQTEPTHQDELFEADRYDDFCYITTEPLTPWQTHKAYGQRATCETWIEEAKNQMGLGHLKTADFLANAVLFQSAIIAYNTVRQMALLSGNATLRRWEPQTIRTFLVRVAGTLLTGARQLKIKLPDSHLHPKAWEDWLALSAPPG